MIWGIKLAFGSCLTGATNMKSKEISMKVKEAIIKLKKQHTSIRKIAKTLGVARSTVGFILQMKESTAELNNIKRPGRPRKTTKVDDRRIISLVKKNPFITSTEIKNTLEEVGTSLSKSTIKRHLHECKYRGFTTRCKPLVTFKNRKARLDFARKHLKNPPMFWKKILWADETKINLYQTDGKWKVCQK